MAERHVLDVAQLRTALKGAARPHCQISPRAGSSAEFIVCYTAENGREEEIFNSRSLWMLADTLSSLLSANTSIDPDSLGELLADVALAISSAMLKPGQPRSQRQKTPATADEVLTDFVIACTTCLARARRHYIPISRILRGDLAKALSTNDRSLLVRVFRASFGIAQYTNWPGHHGLMPVPRAFIASPLTHLDDAAHEVVLNHARTVRKLLNSLGMTVIAPSPYLTPSTASDESAYDLYRLERLLISGSDLVVAVGAEHDSWGISRTVSWAEASGAITIVLSGEPILSRILDGTSHRTYRPDIEELENLLTEMLSLIRNHAQDRVAMSGHLRQPVVEARSRLETLDREAFEQSPLTRERALELLDHPVMIDHASHTEGRALRRLLGHRLDPVLQVLRGATTYSHNSDQDMRGAGGLSAQSLANLQSVAQVEGWTDAEVLRLISDHLSAPVRAGYAYRNSKVSGSDWRQLYERTFGSDR